MLGFELGPLGRRRWESFCANRRGYYSLWVFCALFLFSGLGDFIANDKPLLLSYKGAIYYPVFVVYPETTFDGIFETETEYRDPFVIDLINNHGWMLWPPVRYSYDRTVGPGYIYQTRLHPLGTQCGIGIIIVDTLLGPENHIPCGPGSLRTLPWPRSA